ncbi:MAG: cupin domain-containing protein [Oscillatoriales cyanobacterium]|uniref:cupin domain-containing protein n=1 Tax=unclassified Microcoleus TaxID=2642155 RepID=UPI001D344394|nr:MULTISPECIES: cupin domain-containing protein [unclassified Microcoleus]TAE78560.1 MAG: cupin domain-containing protein [Oscillatoriales cyanobacterium]TAF16852.1 MAG: cupin domain-containing protein [Oscillatoriales cyanobacterium]TAF52824.1 MAG: cupin domain-containing protein [Oscillatoriales cyanobacterium]
MINSRLFALEAHVHFSEQVATVTEIIETENSSIAIWGVRPGQIVQAHLHPDGQDTWVMLRGTLTYYLGNGQSQILNAGEVAIAEKNQIHGAVNDHSEDALFVSIYSAPQIGYEQASP